MFRRGKGGGGVATKSKGGTHPALALAATVVGIGLACWYVGHKIDHPLTSNLPLLLLAVPVVVGLTIFCEGRGAAMVVGGAVIMITFGYIAVDAGRTGKVAHAMYQFGSQLPGSDKPLKIPGSGR